MQDAKDGNHGGSNQLLRQALDETMISLGGPIYKTITWHMNNKGLFSDSKKIDLPAIYLSLKELVGPGADMIMEDTWTWLQKRNGMKPSRDTSKISPDERIRRMMEISEA